MRRKQQDRPHFIVHQNTDTKYSKTDNFATTDFSQNCNKSERLSPIRKPHQHAHRRKQPVVVSAIRRLVCYGQMVCWFEDSRCICYKDKQDNPKFKNRGDTRWLGSSMVISNVTIPQST